MENKINFIDLFSGCGGLLDGFLQSNKFSHIASVEWEKAPVNTLRKRLQTITYISKSRKFRYL